MSNNLVQTISLKDKGYSSGVKSAKQALEELGKQNGVVNNSFQNTSKELNSAKKFYSQLRTEYEKLSDEAKKGEFGQAMHRQLETTKKDLQSLYEQTARTKKELQDMQEQANKKVGGGKGDFSFKQMGGDVMGKLGLGSLTKISAGPMALTAMLAGVGEEYVRSTKLAMDYESALSNLKAITGIAGKDFDTFKEKIEATGFATSKSFEEVTDAYTKVGSAMPELLKTPDALDAVTRAAITLSKASRMDLDSAINSLTGIMNQFGASASQANRYINALAAGAKEGSAGIQYLATAMDKCGTSLATTNLGIEQGTALIEVLAKKIPDASTAGTNLRNILLKMSQAQDKFNPKVVGMEQALKNLQPKIKDTTFMVKMFGSENVNAAITLAQNVDKYTELTQKVTGTNEAFKQAGTQTDNLQSAMKRLSTNWDNYIVSINKSTGPLMKAVNLLAKMVEYVAYLNRQRGLGSEAIDKISKKYGGTTDYQEKATRKEQIKAYNDRMRALKDEYNLRVKQMKAYEKGMNDTKRGKAVQAQQATLYTANKLVADKLFKEIERFRQSGKEYFYGVNNTPTATTTSGNTTTDTSKTKSPKQIYDEKISQIESQLANKLIDEKKAVEEKMAAIKQYISALSANEKSTKKNKNLIESLSAKYKGLKERLTILEEQENDAKAIEQADKDYTLTIARLNRARENKWISESEYQSQYITAIKNLIKGYEKVTDMSDDMIKVIGEKQKEIKDFELQQAESKAATEYLTTFRKAERIYNGGKVARQAPANYLHEAHESAYIQLRTKADHAPEEVLKPGYTPTKKDEDWFRDYQGFLKENKHLLGEMYVKINNIKDAVKHAKKLDLVDTIETEHYKKDAQGNFIKDAQGKLIEDVPYETLIDKYKKDLESVGFKFNFDEEDFKKKIEELGEGTSIPIHFELKPSFETVDTLAEIAENWKQDDEVYRQIMKFHEDYKKDLEEFKHYVDTWQFPDKLKTRGDASNFSNRKNISYNRLSEKANTFYHGKGRLNDNLMEEGVTQKMQEDLDKYLAKYKDIETEYTKMKEIAEKNGLDFKDSVDVKVEADLNDLEGKIAKLHDDIQDRLTFEIQINGALDAVDALGGISNLGSELASIPDTLDSIEESSNDAAAAFQYFGLIINTVQGIIEGIQLVMTVYKGLTDAFTASEMAKSVAMEADTIAQSEQAGVAEANVPAKAGEAAANKALESSALDLAAANIFLAHSYIPFAGPAIAAGLTTAMMGTMAGVHATALSLTAMANGGIVGDGTFSGDQTLIRANKGEMILNTQQQANLFSLLDGVIGTNQGGGKVKFEISGDNLVGVLNNHNRMKAKVGNRLR